MLCVCVCVGGGGGGEIDNIVGLWYREGGVVGRENNPWEVPCP